MPQNDSMGIEEKENNRLNDGVIINTNFGQGKKIVWSLSFFLVFEVHNFLSKAKNTLIKRLLTKMNK